MFPNFNLDLFSDLITDDDITNISDEEILSYVKLSRRSKKELRTHLSGLLPQLKVNTSLKKTVECTYTV